MKKVRRIWRSRSAKHCKEEVTVYLEDSEVLILTLCNDGVETEVVPASMLDIGWMNANYDVISISDVREEFKNIIEEKSCQK